MKGKGKMKVFFLILIAAVNLFMHVNSTEKRRITCGKRATFLYIFSSLGQLNSIPQVNFWHELFPSLFCLVPSRSRFPLALYACSLHSRISLVSLGLSRCSRVPQSPLSLGKASGGGSSLLTFYIFSFISLAIDLVLAVR